MVGEAPTRPKADLAHGAGVGLADAERAKTPQKPACNRPICPKIGIFVRKTHKKQNLFLSKKMKSYKIDKFSAKVFSKWKKCGKIYSVWKEITFLQQGLQKTLDTEYKKEGERPIT